MILGVSHVEPHVPRGRCRADICMENQRFVERTFPLDRSDGDGGGTRTCLFCDLPFPAGKTYRMLRHSLGRDCLVRRVERGLMSSVAATLSNLTRACRAARSNRCLEAYRTEHFRPTAVSAAATTTESTGTTPLHKQRRWVCRRCHGPVLAGGGSISDCP